MLLKLLHRTSWVSLTMKSPYNALRFNIASDCWPTVGQQSADSFWGSCSSLFPLVLSLWMKSSGVNIQMKPL